MRVSRMHGYGYVSISSLALCWAGASKRPVLQDTVKRIRVRAAELRGWIATSRVAQAISSTLNKAILIPCRAYLNMYSTYSSINPLVSLYLSRTLMGRISFLSLTCGQTRDDAVPQQPNTSMQQLTKPAQDFWAQPMS